MGLSLAARRLHVQLEAEIVGHRALRSLFNIDSLDLAGGESLALYGPSGSGKTTLLNLLAGLQQQSGAEIVWSDMASAPHPNRQHDIMQLRGSARETWRLKHAGLVFQQFQLFGAMTALENVLTPYRFDHWRCPPQAHLRAAELLDQFGIEASARTGRLSRGEQQRVAIARALVREPAVVLADEPTASLDPRTASHVMDILIQECSHRKVTLIVATHDATLAPRFDHALALHNGQLMPMASTTTKSLPERFDAPVLQP
jgi:putative ABC transport system ATP-binding protein